MIATLEGVLAQRGSDSVIVDVHGVGYLVTVGSRTLTELPRAGERVRLYTYTYVREDALGLFGFLSQEELAFFKLLLSVKGIGPKAGLGSAPRPPPASSWNSRENSRTRCSGKRRGYRRRPDLTPWPRLCRF